MADKLQEDNTEIFVIDDAETLKVIADGRRLQILKALRRPKTVKQIAATTGISPSRLYYHVNMLEEHGLIKVVETNVVSGIIEKVYRATAREYRVDDSLFRGPEPAEEHVDTLLRAIFDEARTEIRRSVRAGLMRLDDEEQDEPHKDMIWQGALHLSPEQQRAFFEKLDALLREAQGWSDANEEGDFPRYGVTLALYPIVEGDEDQDTEAAK